MHWRVICGTWLSFCAVAFAAPQTSDRGRREQPALFDRDPAHPWNRLHRALFDRDVEVSVPPCAITAAGCAGLAPAAVHAAPFVGRRAHIGGDEPLPFLGGDVWFLEEPARHATVLAAIADARRVDPLRQPLAATLLQIDCWERFDAIVDTLAHGQPKRREALETLLPPLAALIRHLAQPAAVLRTLAPNESELARAFPTLLPGFATRDGWAEIRSEFTDAPDDPWRSTTRHAERSDFRMVFRVFVRPSSGLDWFHENLEAHLALPSGSTALLVGSPLAIAKEGELVPLPLLTLAELRAATNDTATTVASLPHEVLEAKRAALLTHPRAAGGFARVRADALVPMGATCMPNRTTQVPLKSACAMCHGNAATTLTGPLAHGQLRVAIEVDPNAAAQAVIAAKQATASFARLKALLGKAR